MGCIFHFAKFNRLLICGTFIAFSITTIPMPCHCQINTNDVAFAYKIEKLLEKVKKVIDKNEGNELIDLMLNVKREVEAYSGFS